MERIKIILKKITVERSSGWLLIFLAGFILASVAFNTQAESKKEIASAPEQNISEPEVQGEADENINNDAGNILIQNDNPEKVDNQKVGNKTAVRSVDIYGELKANLKKYCNKSGSSNRSKCRAYCSDAKKNSKKNNDKFDKLKENYCSSKNEDENSDSQNISAENPLQLKFIAGSSNFALAFNEGETALDFMKRAKSQGLVSFDYEEYSGFGAMITEINGTENGKDNKYWMLYVNGKLSDKGCSSEKLSKSTEKVEWKFEGFDGSF